MKKVFSFLAASAVSCVVCAAPAYAEIGAAALNDGVYNIEVESDSSMFKVVNCDITVNNGKMTAAVTLSGTGYGKLFIGTGEQAAAAAESEHIPFVEGADGKYVYTFELSALDTEIAVAAWSTKNSAWYDRKLTFKSNTLPESAHNAANGGLLPEPVLPEQPVTSEPVLPDQPGQPEPVLPDQSGTPGQSGQPGQIEHPEPPEQSGSLSEQQNENPSTGAVGMTGISIAAAAVVVVFARNKKR